VGPARIFGTILLLASLARAEPEKLRLGWGHTWTNYYKPSQFKAYRNPPGDVEALEGDDLWYVDIELAPGKVLLCALNPKADPPQGWFDRNFDRQVKDEEPVELPPYLMKLQYEYEIDWRDTKDGPVHKLPVHLIIDKDLSKGHVWLRVKGHRQAKVVLGGRLRWIVALSGNGDLRIDDEQADRIYIDLDGDGRIQTGDESHERVLLDTAFRAGQRGYVLTAEGTTGATLLVDRARSVPPPRARPWPTPRRMSTPYPSSYSARGELKPLIEAYKKSTGFARTTYSRQYQLRRIGGFGSVTAVKFLLKTARKDPDPDMRLAAAQALGNRRNRDHAGLVITAAGNCKEPDVAKALTMSVFVMNPPDRGDLLLNMLETCRVDEVRETAADLLANSSRAWRARLGKQVGSFRQPAADYYAYRAATRFSRDAPEEELLARALQGKDARLKLLAYSDMAWLGMRDTRPYIVALLHEEAKRRKMNAELARLAVDALGTVAGVEEVPLLFGLMPVARLETRNRLVDLLKLIRDEPAIAVIRSQLEAKHATTRGTAVRVLAALPGDANGEALAAALAKEKDPEIRLLLVNALGQGGVRSAGPTLVKLISASNKNEQMKEAALIALARIGFRSNAVEDYFNKEAASRDWTKRLDAVDVAARYAGASAVPFLAERLEDKEWRVRMAAAQGLGRIRTKECVAPLITALETEEDRRPRRAIADALFRITGQHLYDMYELWVKWWSRNHASFVVSAVVPAKKKRKGGRQTVADFYGVPVESERVVFVIDKSGSMGGAFFRGEKLQDNELDKAVKEMLKVVRRMRNGAQVNVVFFESGIERWAKKLRKLDKKTRASLQSYVEAQEPTGGTNLYDGLEMAMRMRDVDTIYLLSDGAPGSGKWVADEDILREIGKLNKKLRIQIHTVSLGRESDLLKQLAEQSGGTYVRR
jgi:HEAT repeat protein